ncbi:NTP transferase domain-containing protein [Flavobacteriaceae bacterium Ap0902]|nr:NTP transferase domain-containing protein [Flavobacteriaceae bacterium Ap0902]
MKVMLFAAGLGTRLKPFTLSAPKALYPINGKPLLQRNIEYLKSYGFNDFIINVHHFADQIRIFLKEHHNFDVKIHISDESKELLETGGGLIKAKDLLKDKPFLVMNSDILTNLPVDKLIAFHQKEKPLVSLAISDRKSTRKLLFDANYRLCGWKDLRNGDQIIANPNYTHEFAFSGMHIIEPDFFELNTFHGKFSIMKPYMDLMGSQIIKGFDHTGYHLVDVGKPESVEKAEALFN